MSANRRQGGRRRGPPSKASVFERIELAEIAIRKLYFDEELTDRELNALLNSDYVQSTVADLGVAATTLYTPPVSVSSLLTPIHLSSVELDLLGYFGRHPELLHSLSPRRFEELVASVFKNSGFEVELTPETRDGGIDIIAVRNDSLIGREVHLIECKRYLPHNTVGIGIVQRLIGIVETERATKGIIVTTSSFTRDAQLAAEKVQHRMALNGYRSIASWLSQFRQEDA